jgi:O-antigen biosynthesis protein WbqP
MIRLIDIIISSIAILILLPIFLILFVIGYVDTRSPIFFQKRMGKSKKIFVLIKFRSMKTNYKSIPTHLVDVNAITDWGSFIRRSKLDELPQLINVLLGDMSLVGPRPNLINQKELIMERENMGVYQVRPGITGLAQINKIDMSNPALLAKTDAEMVKDQNLKNYFKLLMFTLVGFGFGDRVIKRNKF